MKLYSKFRVWLLKIALKDMVEKFVVDGENIELHLKCGTIIMTKRDEIKSDIEELLNGKW